MFWGAATFPSPVARNLSLRFCCLLIYILITDTKVDEFAELSFSEGDAPLFSNVIVICIKTLLLSNNLISSAVDCLLSWFTIPLRTAGKLAKIHFLSESVQSYAGRKYEWQKIDCPLS